MKVKQYSLLAGFALMAVAATFLSNSSGPQAAVAGSPLEGGNDCTQCHGGTANSGSGNLEIGGIDVYTPGETYTISVNVNDESSSKFGFQAIAVDENNNAVGSIAAGTGTKTINSGGNEYVTQSSANSDGAFSFEWTAPSSDVGSITFYAAGNATNSNGSVSGDNVYTNTLTASTGSVGLDQSLEINDVAKVINEGNGNLTISAIEKNRIDVEVYTLGGQLVGQSSLSQNSFRLKNGIYLIKVLANNKAYTQKVSI
ncbi:MAG: T9SS type A sorting domain-containing protein [Bacteroidia bacterium]